MLTGADTLAIPPPTFRTALGDVVTDFFAVVTVLFLTDPVVAETEAAVGVDVDVDAEAPPESWVGTLVSVVSETAVELEEALPPEALLLFPPHAASTTAPAKRVRLILRSGRVSFLRRLAAVDKDLLMTAPLR